MPTESNEKNLVKLLYKDQDGFVKELCNYEHKEKNSDDAVDAMKYVTKGMAKGEMSTSMDISKENTRRILKLYGLERITRKRFKKLLMGCGLQRNAAEEIAKQLCEDHIPYTPLVAQQVIETIIKEMEEEKE